jgi:hypothetical protein
MRSVFFSFHIKVTYNICLSVPGLLHLTSWYFFFF